MLEGFETSTNVNQYLHRLKNKNRTLHFFKRHEIINDWKFQWRGKMIFSHGSNHSKGVLILINERLQYEIRNTVIDDKGRYILLEMTIQESPFLLLNL